MADNFWEKDTIVKDKNEWWSQDKVAQQPVAPASKERTVGEAFKDVGAGLVSGAGSLVQLPGQLYGLATGNFSKTGALGLGEDIAKYGEEMKSAGLKAREAERATKVQEAEKEGQFAAFKAGFGETITDPALFTSFIAEQVPNILPMILTGGATAALTAGRASAAALAKGATKEAAAAAGKSAGAKAGTTAAVQTGAVMQGADIGAGSYDEIYGELRAKGLSEEQAAAETINKARAAGLTGYGLSVLANRFLPGGKALEEILAGKKITGSRIGSGAVTALKEIPSENIEEVGGRIAQNVAAKQAGLDRELLAGTGETAALATLGAAGIGGAAGALAPRRSESEQAAKEVDAFKQEEEEFRKQFGKAEPVEVKEPELPTEFPGGYTATRREVERKEVPEGFGIFAEGSQAPLSKVTNQEEADAKLRTLSEIRQQEQSRLAAESEKISADVNAEQRKLDVMEATGQTDTDEYVQAKAAYDQKAIEATQKIDEITQKIADYSAPLSIAPLGTRVDVQSAFDVKKGEEAIGTFQTLEEAQAALQQREPELFKQAEEAARVETDDRVTQLKNTLTPMLAKFGLQDVGLNVVDRIENNAGGSYLDSLINISLTESEPIKTMRHEALHALKDLQFFTPQQYKALEERANKQWIKEYLQDQMSDIEVDGKVQTMSRLDAYKRLGYTQEAIVEEAIADAFGAYARGATPPPGMIAALFKKLQNFFLNFGQALRGAGFESADDVFQRVERGELKSRKPKPQAASKAKTEEEVEEKAEAPEAAKPPPAKPTEPKYSLAGEGVPMSTRNLMEQQTPIAQQDLGLNTEAGRSGTNNVRDIAKALNQQTLDQLGAMKRNKLTQDESTRISEAIADEVAYQLGTTAKTGTGLGWYSNNYPNAVKRLGKRFPELSTNQYARSVFSALVAVTSNGERVTKNIDNAITLYTKLRKGKPLVAMGNRRATALENNLQVIQDLMDKHGPNFEKVLLKEITVAEMNAQLRKMGKKADGSYLANTVVPAAAVYFGPKLGAFYANLSGSEGYLTMDLWWTRSINRMRGLLIPKATAASIAKFRDMMESPGATRDEVIAASIPLRNKYEEYGWNSELEHLVKAKEPSTNAAKPAWFKKAEEAAGDAYEQLLFEHNLEKMANTIYKNEFEMLAEAPFTATDRKFMYDAARKAQTLLRNDGIDLSLADIQAALWYYEKRLYAKLSGRKADDIGYEEAIIAQANQGSGRARPSVVFDQRADSRDEPGAEVAVSDEVRGQPSGGKERLKDGENETIRPDQSAVRPSPRGKLSIKQSEERGERGGREQPRKIKILEGAPSVPGFSGPIPEIIETAERYAKENGIPYKRQTEYVKVDPERAGRIAQAYEEMTHAPQDPEVRKAYKDLIRQTTAQYEALLDSGYEFWFMDMSKPDNQKYASSPWNALRDLKDNKQMGVFPTNDGFGSSEDFSPEANPLLADTGFKWPSGGPDGPLQPVLANDLFRAVHDAFGHGIEGAGFRADGEENAWQAHVRLFTGPALGAITSETRGQNSWLNYGPYGEKNRTAKIEDTVFADQKTGLMPEWTWQEGISDDEGIVLGEKQPDAISVNGSHYGKTRVSELDASKYGTGLRGAERRRLDRTDDERIKKRAYFYIAKPDGSTPTPESGVGQYVYTQKFDNILGQGPEMGRLFREANGDSNNFESLIVDAGYDGYAIPEMGMMVILNHNVPVNYVGPRSEVGVAKLSLRIAQPNSILAKRMDGIGIKSINDFWKRIQDVMIGRGDRNPGLSGAFDKRSTADQVKQAISVWKQDVEDEGIESYLNRFTDSKGKIPGLDEIISGPPVVKKMLTEAGIRPTMGNAVAAYNSLKGSSAAEASNDIRYSLRTSFPSAKEAEDAAYDKAPPSTKEFKLFFGGSTIMDEGRPQPMYHGSASGFDTFSENKPIFISPDPEFAEQFAEDRAKDEGKSLDEMRIYPLWVRAETPFDYENKDHAEMVAQKIIADQKLSGPDSAVRLKKSTPKANAFKKEIAGGLWSTIEDPVVQDALKSLGFDSFYVQEQGNKNLAVFKAEQVKSITGNIGDFSLESKDMRFSLPTIPQNLQDRMGETTTRRERKTVIQSIVDAITPTSAADFRAKYLNRYNQMSVYDKKLAEQMGGAALLADQSAESAALFSDVGAGVAASAMGYDDRNGGIPVLRNGITTIDKRVKGLVASLGPLAAYGDPAIYQRYQYWAMVKRGQRLNKNGTLTGIDSADVAFAKILEQKHPEFVSVQKDLIAFNNGLVQYMVDTGVLSKERGQMYTKYADYIPFYRQMDGDQTLGPNLFQSLSGVKPPKKLKGAVADEAPLADFLETMVRNTQSSIQAGIKNYAAQRALNVAVQVQAPGMGAVRLNTKEDGPDIINVLEKGNLVSYRTPDPLLVNAMMSLNQSELPFMGFLSAPADLLRTLVTKEPGFMMANMMRDSLSAWVTSGQKMTPIAGTVINFGKALARKSPGFEAMLDAGIIGGYEFSENIEKSGFKLEKDLAEKAGKKAPLALRPFKSVWDALGKGTTASDAATRALIYERVLADTGNEAEALYRSLEVMNFHRKGSSPLIRVLTAAIPFFNARLQGLDLFYRASTGNMNNKDAASIQRQFFMRGMTMMALSGLYWMLVSDDEEYKKQEQETKDNNWIIPSLGVKIPIPFEVGVLFKVIPERIMAYSFGNDTGEDLQKSMIRSAVNTFAFNPIPQTIKPVLEAYVDYNMFTMRPILGQGMKDIEPEYQVGPSTSNFATVLAQSLGLSPMKVDHIIKGYTGTIGMYAIDTIDMVLDQFGDSPKPTKRFEQLPVIKRFASDPEARGFVTQYYELKDAVDTTVRTMNLLEKTGQYEEYAEYLVKNQGTLAFKDYVRDTEKTMKDLRDMRTSIRSSSMTGDEKRDALLEISRMESAITSGIQEIKKAIAEVQ